MEITDLPFNQLIGITICGKDGASLCLPKDVRYTNHLGTVHASALLSLAEAASGHFLVRELNDLAFPVLPVVRRIEAKFKKPALGAVFTRVNVPPEQKADLISALKGKGRALFEIPVDVLDENDTHALAATFEWFIVRNE